MSDLELICPFFNQSHDYVLGFEMGRIWSRMRTHEADQEYQIHGENEEQAIVIAARCGYRVAHRESMGTSGWVAIDFELASSSPSGKEF